MVIDCHYHLEERLLKTEELLQKMDAAGVAKTALMGCQVDPYPEPPSFLINLLHVLLTQGFLRSIGKLFVSQFDSAGNIKILGKSYQIYPDPDNAAVFATVGRYPDRFLGWIFVNPQGKKDQVAEFEKWKSTPGWVGVKAHCFWNHHAPIALVPVAERLAKTGKPLLIHAGYGVEGDFMALLKEVPNLKLILAHTGFPLYSDTWKRIGPMKNVFVDLSQTSYVNEKTLRNAVEYLGGGALSLRDGRSLRFSRFRWEVRLWVDKEEDREFVPRPGSAAEAAGRKFRGIGRHRLVSRGRHPISLGRCRL